MNRGEIWLSQIGRKRRPVLVLTRSAVLDFRDSVTVAEITTTIRGLLSEVPIESADVDLDRPSAVNCDGLHTRQQSTLRNCLGSVSDETMNRVCAAIGYALDF